MTGFRCSERLCNEKPNEEGLWCALHDAQHAPTPRVEPTHAYDAVCINCGETSSARYTDAQARLLRPRACSRCGGRTVVEQSPETFRTEAAVPSRYGNTLHPMHARTVA